MQDNGQYLKFYNIMQVCTSQILQKVLLWTLDIT